MEKTFTSENFSDEVLKAEKPVLVDFYADWCVPCKMMAPTIEELALELSETAIIGKLNIDENMDVASAYRVMNIPTLIVFRDGKPAGKLVGVQEKEDILRMLNA